MLDAGVFISNAKLVQDKVVDDLQVAIGSKFIKYVLKKEMKLVYRKSRKIPPRANSERCLVLR